MIYISCVFFSTHNDSGCLKKECRINGETRCIDPLDDPDNDCIPTDKVCIIGY